MVHLDFGIPGDFRGSAQDEAGKLQQYRETITPDFRQAP